MSYTPKENIIKSLAFLSKEELHEVKSKIEELLLSNNSTSTEAIQYLKQLKKEGKAIFAIKEYQKATGCGLKEAKDFIDGL